MTLIATPAILITRSGDTQDTYGELVKTETSTTITVDLQPIHSDEDESGNQGVTSYNLYIEGLVDLHSDDAIIVDGVTYELRGDAVPRHGEVVPDYTHAVVRRVR